MPVDLSGNDTWHGWRRLTAVLAVLGATTILALNGVVEGQAVVAILGASIPMGWSASQDMSGARYLPQQRTAPQSFHAQQDPATDQGG